MAWQPGQRITAQRLLDNTPNTVAYSAITTNTSTTTAAEVVGFTTPPIMFRTGRAYRIRYKGGVFSNTPGQQGTAAVRKTDLGGQTYINAFRIYLPAAGTVAFDFSNICTNTSGANITAALVGTFGLTVAAGGTVNLAASTPNPAYIHVEDIGQAADYAGATAIT
ncbi:hypothetical protein ACIRQP_21660 [Streptomyces sp. NPDC102274]|uniref:hypothetical protein n=1 Tax=Streptomyces sp. NPDC102274 TaxID=3366151 RepID=UPI0038129C56